MDCSPAVTILLEVPRVFSCLGIHPSTLPNLCSCQTFFLTQEMEDKLDNECHSALCWSTPVAFCIDP